MEKNQIISMLEETATLLALKDGSSVFEVRAYENAARAVSALDGDFSTLVKQDKLKGTPGLGPTIIKRIEEAMETGHMVFLDELRANTPAVKLAMMRIPGVGPKKINAIYDQLHVTSIEELEQACREDKVAHLPSFGKKTQDKILQGIAFLQKHGDRYQYPVAEAAAAQLYEALHARPEVVRLAIGGSLRRKRETIKDIDMVASVANDAGDSARRSLMDFFTSQPSVHTITGKGETKSSVVLESGIAMDLRLVTDDRFPSTLHHFTGSREHHIALRRHALSMHMTINDYGLFRVKGQEEELIPCSNEQEIYAALGMDYIEPELREDMGEIEAALHHKLPTLVQEDDLRGVVHVHSTWSDGKTSIREMAEACIARGFTYLGMTDHSKVAAYASGLSEDDLRRQWNEIDQLNEEFSGRLLILKGTECDILRDGSLDYDDTLLASLDFVVASIHSNFQLSQEEQTRRLLRAIENPYVDIIGHPTGRILLGREGYPVDLEAVIDAAARNGTCIEINGDPARLDLDWRYVRKARDKGIKIPVNSDAHSLAGLNNLRYGIGIARKGWLRASDVLNTMEAEEIVQFFKARRKKAQ